MRKIFIIFGVVVLAISLLGCHKDALFLIEENGRKGFIDRRGNIVIPARFDDARQFSEGLAFVRINDTVGYIDAKGRIRIKFNLHNFVRRDGIPRFQLFGFDGYPSDFHEDLAGYISKDTTAELEGTHDNLLYFDKRGEKVILIKSTEFFAFPFCDGLAKYRSSNDKVGFIDKKGLTRIEPQYDEASEFSNGFAAVQMDKKWGYIDKNGNYIIDPIFRSVGDFSKDGLAVVCMDFLKYGYVNNRGETAIDPIFDLAEPFSEGLASVTIGDNKFFINIKGETVFSHDFDYVFPFSEGLACAWKDHKWGYINKKGEVVIPLQYYYAAPFQNGLAMVGDINGNWTGYINKKGKLVYKMNAVLWQ